MYPKLLPTFDLCSIEGNCKIILWQCTPLLHRNDCCENQNWSRLQECGFPHLFYLSTCCCYTLLPTVFPLAALHCFLLFSYFNSSLSRLRHHQLYILYYTVQRLWWHGFHHLKNVHCKSSIILEEQENRDKSNVKQQQRPLYDAINLWHTAN